MAKTHGKLSVGTEKKLPALARGFNADFIEKEITVNSSPQNNLDDSAGRNYRQLVVGSFIMTMCPFMHHVSCGAF